MSTPALDAPSNAELHQAFSAIWDIAFALERCSHQHRRGGNVRAALMCLLRIEDCHELLELIDVTYLDDRQ